MKLSSSNNNAHIYILYTQGIRIAANELRCHCKIEHETVKVIYYVIMIMIASKANPGPHEQACT